MEVSQVIVTALVSAFSALVGFSGGLIALWDGRKRLKIQLDNDRAIKTADREIGMRKEAYGQVFEALAKLDTYIGRRMAFDNPESPEFLRPHDDAISALSKATPFGSDKAITAGQKLLKFYASNMATLLAELKEYHDVSASLSLRNDSLGQATADNDRIQKAISSELESGDANKARLDSLSRARDWRIERIKALHAEINDLLDKKLPALNKFLQAAMRYAADQMEFRRELLDAMRADLGISTPLIENEIARAAQDAHIAEMRKFVVDESKKIADSLSGTKSGEVKANEDGEAAPKT